MYVVNLPLLRHSLKSPNIVYNAKEKASSKEKIIKRHQQVRYFVQRPQEHRNWSAKKKKIRFTMKTVL